MMYDNSAFLRDLATLRSGKAAAAVDAARGGVLSSEHAAMVLGVATLAALHRRTEVLKSRVDILQLAVAHQASQLTRRPLGAVRDRIIAFVGTGDDGGAASSSSSSSTHHLSLLRVVHEKLLLRQCSACDASRAGPPPPLSPWTSTSAQGGQWSTVAPITPAALAALRSAFDGSRETSDWVAALRDASVDGRIVLTSDAIPSLLRQHSDEITVADAAHARKQDAKDIKRDTLTANGAVLSAGGVEYAAVMTRLRATLTSVANDAALFLTQRAETQQQLDLHPASTLTTYAEALLRAGNRTTSGGCGFDAIGYVLNHNAHIAPRGGDPIDLSVDIGPFRSCDGGWGFGLRCAVRATTRYQLMNMSCEDMTDPSAAFAKVAAHYLVGKAVHVLPSGEVRAEEGRSGEAVVELEFELG